VLQCAYIHPKSTYKMHESIHNSRANWPPPVVCCVCCHRSVIPHWESTLEVNKPVHSASIMPAYTPTHTTYQTISVKPSHRGFHNSTGQYWCQCWKHRQVYDQLQHLQHSGSSNNAGSSHKHNHLLSFCSDRCQGRELWPRSVQEGPLSRAPSGSCQLLLLRGPAGSA
jgi:hypothetical protein